MSFLNVVLVLCLILARDGGCCVYTCVLDVWWRLRRVVEVMKGGYFEVVVQCAGGFVDTRFESRCALVIPYISCVSIASFILLLRQL